MQLSNQAISKIKRDEIKQHIRALVTRSVWIVFILINCEFRCNIASCVAILRKY